MCYNCIIFFFLVENRETSKENAAPEKKTKYSKAQARQRFKQGKL